MVLNSAKYTLDGYYYDGKNAYRLYIKNRT